MTKLIGLSNLKNILHDIQDIGLRTVFQTLRYSVVHSWLDYQYWRGKQVVSRQPPGQRTHLQATPSGARLSFSNLELVVEFLAADQVHIDWQPDFDGSFLPVNRERWAEVKTEVDPETGICWMRTDQLQVEIDLQGAITFRDGRGQVLREEQPPLRRLGTDGQALGWEQQAKLCPQERIYGLGEQATPMNHRGLDYRLWNMESAGSYSPGKGPLYLTIPVYLSVQPGSSYLIFYENSSEARLSLPARQAEQAPGNGQAEAKIIVNGGPLRYDFMTGTPAQLLDGYTKITEKPTLPPRWALGFHQSRWGYKTEADIRQVVQGFQEHDLPLSAIHLDIDYMDGYRVFTVNQERFPDLKGLADDLHAQGIQLVTILDPGVKKDPHYFLYQEGLEQGQFCRLSDGKPVVGVVWPGEAAFPDFTCASVRAWWGKQYQRLLEQGVDGFWHDMNEPASFVAWGDMTLPLATQHSLEGTGGDHLLGHNLYGHGMARAGYEALRQLRPERRPWILSRSGWSGTQRYAWNWTGDIDTSWESLRQTIPTVLGLGLSGIPFTGPDIGGFSGNPNAELYLRWLQLATFLPFFRAHSALGTNRREPWAFGEPTTSIARQFLRLRYRLMPYLYSLAWQVAQTGAPLVRPLFWPSADDPALLDVEDAFFLGDSLLIAPILEEGASQRHLRLPAGNWYDFWEDSPQPLSGSQEVELVASREQIPVLVRAGSLIPMEEADHLELHLYPQESGESQAWLYSDAGDGYGPSRLDQFTLHWYPNQVQILRTFQGEYPFPYTSTILHLHGKHPTRILVDDQSLSVTSQSPELTEFTDLLIEYK